jgi:hypothetical protein
VGALGNETVRAGGADLRAHGRAARRVARPPLVGRATQLDHVLDLLTAAENGEPQLAVIQGPAGIGKTRLVEEVAERARRRRARVAMGRCWPDGEAPPFWPWRSILRELGAPEGLLEERPSSAQGRFARFVAVLHHLHCTPARAFVIAIDDAHLADPASILLARFLTRELGVPVLLLLTSRDQGDPGDGQTAQLLAELAREWVSIPLSGLSDDAVGAYLTAAGLPPSDPALLRAVCALTQGNPLHLRSLTMQSDLAAGGLGGGLERAIRGGLERCSAGDRRIVALAALLGPDVSVLEVARLAGIGPPAVAEAFTRAGDLGLAADSSGHRFHFVHELVRHVAAASLAPGDRLEAHARAAAMLSGDEPERVSRRAHHALAAAGRSLADAQRAVDLARVAARTLKAADGFEAAASLLTRAAEIHAAAGLATPTAGLLVEQAEAVLACGRLNESRPLFQHAARQAAMESDAGLLARAALGLGGVWVSEHRLANEAEGMLALQRRALAALPPTEPVLRARLTVRLAAEEAYRGGSVPAVLAALEDVRSTGDPHALAEALSLAHHALMTPDHTWARPAMARELITAAADDGLLSLIGLCWHAADLFLLGDPGAAAALAELRLRADALGCRSVMFIVRALDVMLAIRGGAFEQAEAAATGCYTLGTEVGDADAWSYYGAHLAAIRYFQGREAELADLAASMADSPMLIGERDRAFAAAAALFQLRAGRPQAARALLQRLGREGLASIPAASSWLPALHAVVEIAHALGDRGIGEAAYDALLPYADLPIMPSLAIACFGSVHRSLGLAALTSERLDLAIEHFAAAVSANEAWGHRPAAIQAQAELGLARLRRGAAGDEPRGRALLDDAITSGEAAGMQGLAARWSAAAAAVPASRPDEPAGAVLMSQVQGREWRVAFDGRSAVVPDRVGMRYLMQLVAAPDRGIPALTLVVQGTTDPCERGPHHVIDRRTVAALTARMRELRERPALEPMELEELDTLTHELGRLTGLGGRIRSFADAPERARTAATKAIKRAIEEIARVNPAAGRHLAQRVETGCVCCYRLETFCPPAR